jgi:hypothetical protein
MKELKLNLIENAKSSLRHAVLHLSEDVGVNVDDYKYAINDLAHVVELLFKEKLKRVNPAFLWSNIDKYPSKEAFKVTLDEARQRLIKIAGIIFPDKHIENLKEIKNIRNQIVHYEFEINEKIAKTYIGRILSFVFWFAYEHLELDWETEFKKEDSWGPLTSMHQFFEEHISVIEERMHKEKKSVTECPDCGAYAFDLDEEECQMCGEKHKVEECTNCGSMGIEFKMIEGFRWECEEYCVVEKLCEMCRDDGPCDID